MERNITVILYIINIMLSRSRYAANWCKAATRLVIYTFHLVFSVKLHLRDERTNEQTDANQGRPSPKGTKPIKQTFPFHSPHFSTPFHFLYVVSPIG